jgi:hypothetical protein
MSLKSIGKRFALVVFCLMAACLTSYAAQVIYIDHVDPQSVTRQRMEAASRFYGLDNKVILLTGKSVGDTATATVAIRGSETVAVVVTAKALPSLNRKQVFASLRRIGSRSIPLLIAGISEQTPADLISEWSAEAVTRCTASHIEKVQDSHYKIASVSEVAHELGGSELPFSGSEVRYLTTNGRRGVQEIMAATSGGGRFPVFVKANNGGQEVFFLAASVATEVRVTSDPYLEPMAFSNLAPQMMFLRYAAGERAWHNQRHYANLTIDDAWLREPYGHVNYHGLLQEMERHNFHTTVAFIPWNFDRNETAVVSLFRAHADRFSLCVHGNNHYHQEFGAYDSRPLNGQIDDIKQALARMAKFSELTQLPYDQVMVFPHSIAPEQTLGALKRYNFEATANSTNVPLGASAPADPEFALRTATLAFSSFPSLRRYSDEAPRPESQLAIDAFLGNPMLFYVHQGFFANGIGAFDGTAETVNRLQPGTQWRSLGYIVEHLYLEKLRDDGNYEVQAYGGTIHLDNVHQRDAVFFVEKDEDFSLPLTVRVDGQPYAYEKSGKRLRIALPVRAGASREIRIQYENDLNLATIDVSKASMRLNAVRYLCDFRDNVVSKIPLGRLVIRSYGQNEAGWNRGLVVVIGLLALAAVAWLVRRGKKPAAKPRDSPLPVGATARDGAGD